MFFLFILWLEKNQIKGAIYVQFLTSKQMFCNKNKILFIITSFLLWIKMCFRLFALGGKEIAKQKPAILGLLKASKYSGQEAIL